MPASAQRPKCSTIVPVPNPTVLEDAAAAMLMELTDASPSVPPDQ